MHECPSQCQKFRAELGLSQFAEIIGEAHNEREALNLVFWHRPEAVLLSICLPGQGGFEVLRCIKGAFSNCHVILTTPRVTPFLKEAADLLGAAAVCPVPDELPQLRALLQHLAEK